MCSGGEALEETVDYLAARGEKVGVLRLHLYTDEIGLHAAEDKVHVHDLHATILSLLGLSARDLLRTKDPAYATLGLAGESDDALIRAMAHHPTLVQRPIGRLPGKAVLGRQPERLLELAES